MKRSKLLAGASFCVLVALMGNPTAAVAAPGEGDDTDDPAISAAQEPLDQAVDQIEEAALANNWTGYAGADVSIPEARVTVYSRIWPNDFKAFVDGLDNGTTVRTTRVFSRYDRSVLMAQAEELGQSDPTIEAISVEPTGSGLVVYGGTTPGSARKAPNPYVVEYLPGEGEPVPLVVDRKSDSSASPGYKAGARIRLPGDCSTGFAVRQGTQNYLLTAAHCGASGATVRSGSNAIIGTTSNRNTKKDIMRVKTVAAANRVYVGSYSSSSYKYVTSATTSSRGSYVCTSGATSGTNCDLKIVNPTYCSNLFFGCVWGVKATRQTAKRAAAQGDSGGAVLKNTSPTTANVKAAGIISSGIGSSEVACGSGIDPDATGARCFRSVFYIPIKSALEGSTLKTS